MKFAGLDVETTGLEYEQGARVIQIGIALAEPEQYFGSYVLPPKGTVYTPEAMNINNITRYQIERLYGQTAEELDLTFFWNLKNAGYTTESITAVGWNVGSFDFDFVRREFPLTFQFFNKKRVIDLTGIAILFEQRHNVYWRDLKEKMHEEIAKELGESHRHDAVYDARAALVAYRMFKEMHF